MSLKDNLLSQMLWGEDSLPDLDDVYRACLGYASAPGWAVIKRKVSDLFGGFEGLDAIELGCGLGKVSLLFSLLGARVTLLDYNKKQLSAARFIHEQFGQNPRLAHENLLQLSDEFQGRYDVAMSFGTAEHFWGEDRQGVFNGHAQVLKRGGLAILWVPNKYGFLFHIGRTTRKWLHRPISPVDETPFSRKELYHRAERAGFTQIEIKGGEQFLNDFNHCILDLPRILGLRTAHARFVNADIARGKLREKMLQNQAKVRIWNNLFSYPLVLSGIRK